MSGKAGDKMEASLRRMPASRVNEPNYGAAGPKIGIGYGSDVKTMENVQRTNTNGTSSGQSQAKRGRLAGVGAANSKKDESTQPQSTSVISCPIQQSAKLRERPLVVLVDGRNCGEELKELKDVATVAFCGASSADDIHEKVWSEAFGLIMWNTIRLSAEDLEQFRQLKIIVRLENVVENVDLAKATELGIAVCNVPAIGIEATANATMSLILNLYTGTHWTANAVKDMGNRSVVWNPEKIRAIRKRTDTHNEHLGIVGLGLVGQAVAQRALAFGFKIGFYDPHLPIGVERSRNFYRAGSLVELLNWSGCVTLHCMAASENVHMINAKSIQSMRSGAYFVNTAHESLVNEEALAAALKSGQIGAAALDVHNGGAGYVVGPLQDAPNLIVTPHSAYLTEDVYENFRKFGAQEMRRGLTGAIPQSLDNCVNKACLEVRAQLLALGQVALHMNLANTLSSSASCTSGSVRFYNEAGEPLNFFTNQEGSTTSIPQGMELNQPPAAAPVLLETDEDEGSESDGGTIIATIQGGGNGNGVR